MPSFTADMATSVPVPSPAPSPEPEAHVETLPIVEPPAPETDIEHIHRAWAAILISLDRYGKAHPDLKQELLEDIERLGSMGGTTYCEARPFNFELQLSEEELELFDDTKCWAAVASKMVHDWKKMVEELMAHAEERCIQHATQHTKQQRNKLLNIDSKHQNQPQDHSKQASSIYQQTNRQSCTRPRSED
ncbi:hypothetical protein BDR05DRAFT_996874 [Suillus weaverae]|nr:hypothetical protein BDR05DRAFT_996874 [Suillus weaverae]